MPRHSRRRCCLWSRHQLPAYASVDEPFCRTSRLAERVLRKLRTEIAYAYPNPCDDRVRIQPCYVNWVKESERNRTCPSSRGGRL
jgi:hypothetical protein